MTSPAVSSTLFPMVRNQLVTISARSQKLPEERRQHWRKLVRWLRSQQAEGGPQQVVYVCTHNSRRSVFGQVWTAVIADYLGLDQVKAHSAGTVATEVAQPVIDYFRGLGLNLLHQEGRYSMNYAEAKNTLKLFSKTLEDPSLPTTDFAAVMVCDEADTNCPYVPGADLRITPHFTDPKAFDGSAQEVEAYRETSLLVASEVYYALNLLK